MYPAVVTQIKLPLHRTLILSEILLNCSELDASFFGMTSISSLMLPKVLFSACKYYSACHADEGSIYISCMINALFFNRQLLQSCTKTLHFIILRLVIFAA